MQADEARIATWFGDRAETVIETACARIYLSGPTAYKVKRWVDLGYLDFTTLEKRHWAIDRELAFNQAAAADIYRAVHAVTEASDGHLALDGPGRVLDYALEMRRFDETAVLSAHPERVDGDLGEALGRTVAASHEKAPPRPQAGGSAGMKYVLNSNAHLLNELAPQLGSSLVHAVLQKTEQTFAHQSPLLDARQAQGFTRRCHADLHLGNILLENGTPVLFDCIEFSDILSDTDVQYDLAFLLMDLDFRDRREAGVRALDGWLDASARSEGPALFEGLAALPLMLSVRAAVRAHVEAHSGHMEAARAYLKAALDHLSPPPARLLAVGGLSGSGKSRFSRQLAPRIGASPGAVILRTDEIRKRLAGQQPTAGLPQDHYSPEISARVYATLLTEARALLSAGRSVILDATFLDPDFRVDVEHLGAEASVPFHGIWLDAPPAILKARIEARQNDASDATVAVLNSQIARQPGPAPWQVIDTSGPIEACVQNWLQDQGLLPDRPPGP